MCAIPGQQLLPAPGGCPPARLALAGGDAHRMVPDLPLCACRGGAQRRPVPKCSRGADQLPVHGAHVPLRRGPRAYAEGHGRFWSQQVSCFCCFKLLNWPQLLSGQHSVSVLFGVRVGSAPPRLLVAGFLPLPLASAGPLQPGLSFPPPTCSGEQAAGSSSQGDLPVSCSGQHRPFQPFPPGAGLPFGFYMCFFMLLNNELPSHTVVPLGLLIGPCNQAAFYVQVPVRSRAGMGRTGQVLLLAAACMRLLSPLPLLFLHGSCAIPALAMARVCNYKVRLERGGFS